jgi:uncharacterized repeat protein (TIGR01451 family)
MKKTILFFIVFALVIFLYTPVNASAQDTASCQPIFGGGNSCVQSSQLTISKQIQDPQTKQYVTANLVYNIFYGPDQPVPFKITVTNTSNNNLSYINVQDQFPKYIDFLEGNGDFNKQTGIFTMAIAQLKAHSSQSIYIQGKVVSEDQFPANQSNVCLANQVTATSGSEISVANSQFCITKSISGNIASTLPPSSQNGFPIYKPVETQTTPATGNESLAFISLLPIALAGIFLRSKTRLIARS